MVMEREVHTVFPVWFAQRGSRAVWCVGALGVGSLLSNPAAAHMGTGLPGGFESGFIHPFTGIDHLLAMVSVGLWGAFLGRPLIYVLPVVFPAMMVVGAIMGMFSVPLPPVEVGIALSVLVLGGCIALSVRAPVWAAGLVVAIFAVFHGYAHGKELPSAADPVAYSVGFVLATGLLHVSGICLGLLNKVPRGVVATRSMGGIIAVLGVWFLYRAIGT
ncbi:MAG TPA: HupE/UreJ family protein [Steroidobacteraceae bacterium]|jgi:urease accessory protein|nr:HupE/UreJ family protein [Steroidobacteraceae bacterium]